METLLQRPNLRLALLILLLGAFFRINGLARDSRLHPDEALYADLSRRVGIWGDWQLHDTPVDKPPLFFFTGGAFMRILGDREFTVRLPNAFASIIGLAALYAAARRLAGESAALIALLLLALSPMDNAFAASGFTDTQMAVWLLVGLWLLTIRRWGGSGLAFGLSVAVKPATLWFLPLILICAPQRPDRRMIWHWARSFLTVIALISLWDRAGSLGSFWQLGADHYDGRRFVHADEVWARARIWWGWLRYVLPGDGVLLVGGLLLVLAKIFTSCENSRWRTVCPHPLSPPSPPLHVMERGKAARPGGEDGIFIPLWRRGSGMGSSSENTFRTRQCRVPTKRSGGKNAGLNTSSRLRKGGFQTRPKSMPLPMLLAFALAYLGLHWLIAFNLYDRYLLPIAPVLALLVAVGIADWFRARKGVMLAVMFALLVIASPLAWKASQGRTVIASDEGRHTGIDHLAEAMNRDFGGEIFYEHWLGWELRYYLGADPQVLMLYFESEDDLAVYAVDELARIPVPRYFVGPKDEAARWIDTIEAHGLRAEVVYDDGKYAIFSLDD